MVYSNSLKLLPPEVLEHAKVCQESLPPITAPWTINNRKMTTAIDVHFICSLESTDANCLYCIVSKSNPYGSVLLIMCTKTTPETYIPQKKLLWGQQCYFPLLDSAVHFVDHNCLEASN